MLVFHEEEYRKINLKSEDFSIIKRKYKKSPIRFNFESSTGIFHGKYYDTEFKGKFEVSKTHSGFMKGFSYNVKLDFINYQQPEDSDDDFMQLLAKCNRIKIEPNNLNDPDFMKMELYEENQGKLAELYYVVGK